MCSPSPPPAPDYQGAAEATSEGNIEAMRLSTQANRPDEYTPFGSRTWTNLGTEEFDQSGYDEAMAGYEADLAAFNQPVQEGGFKTPASMGGKTPVMPTREDYNVMSDQDKWRSDINLSPEAQGILDKNIQLQGNMADLGLASSEQMQELMGTPFSIAGDTPQYQGPQGELPTYQAQGGTPEYQGPEGSAPTYGGTKQRVTDAMLSRVSSDVSRDRDRRHSQLIAQGIPQGSEAYSREMEGFDRQMTDARQQAEIASTGLAGQEFQSELAGRQQQNAESMNQFLTDMQSRGMSREDAMDMYNSMLRNRGIEAQEAQTEYGAGMGSHQQNIKDILLQRQIPINELSAFRSGSQLQLPQFQGYSPQGPTSGADYTSALGNQSAYDLAGFNADAAQAANMQSGLFGLGAAAILSDIRLKHNYHKVGSLPSGISLYEFSYLGSGDRYVGVMAQEVLPVIPEAVLTMPNGFYAVNYSALR